MKFLQLLYLKIRSKLHKETILAVDVTNDTTIEFKNGSVIKSLNTKNTDTIRGKRSDIKHWYYDDFERCCSKEILDEVLEPYKNKSK